MNGFGSFLCFLSFLLAAPAFAASPEPGVWYGEIDGYRIMLCVEEGKAAYYYAGQSAEIELDMSDFGHWSESVKGKVTGYWKIEEQSSSHEYLKYVKGVWGRLRGKENRSFDLYHLKEVDSACGSSIYRQTLLVPGEKRLSLPLVPDRPAVMATDGSAAILKANGDLWLWSKRQPWPRRVGQGFVRAALGPYHFLGIKDDGSLWAGGERVGGDRLLRMGDGFVAIVAKGEEFALAIRKDGTLWAWGGNPSREKYAKPVLLGKSFVSVDAGSISYAAIKDDGTLWTWGNNLYGQLGIGDGGSRYNQMYHREHLPTLVGGDFAQVSVAYSYMVAVKKDGSLSTWGRSNWRPIENGTDKGHGLPVKIGEGIAQAVAATWNVAAVKTDGTLWLWGRNHPGMFGDCDSVTRERIHPVQVGEDFAQAALGSDFLLALKRDGSEWTFGWPWEGDQIDTPRACRKPARVVFGGVSAWDKPAGAAIAPKLSGPAMPANIVGIAAGASHSAMVTADGTLWTWGNNEYGQLALGTTRNHDRPQRAGGGFQRVSIDGGRTLATKADGSLLFWGAIPQSFPDDDVSRDMKKVLAPTAIFPGLTVFLRSGRSGLGLRNDGTILVWSYYWETSGPPREFGHEIREIGAGFAYRSYALRNDGSLWELSGTPPKLFGENFLHIAVGPGHAYGIKADGSLWAWGNNREYQLGDGTRIERDDPVRIGEGFVQVAAGRFHGIALAADGSVWAWGYNETGALGDGSTSPRARPVKVGDGFARVAAGDYHSIALKSDGTLWAWGANEEGQLGDGTKVTRLSPRRIYPAPDAKDPAASPVLPAAAEKPAERRVSALRVGRYFSCVSFSDGQYKCWGENMEEEIRTGGPRRSPASTFGPGLGRLVDCRTSKSACDETFSSFPFLRGASSVITHYDFACALKNGRIRCAHRNDGGTARSIVDGIHDAVTFDYCGNHGCALLSDGRVKCWGSDNSHGELGDGTKTRSSSHGMAVEVVNLRP
ncbi:MAG: hypothetical protein LBQ62_01440 [Candidatus Accumulibacter sp.]|nr:hypothetical protein [Accumulibacter sp.]